MKSQGAYEIPGVRSEGLLSFNFQRNGRKASFPSQNSTLLASSVNLDSDGRLIECEGPNFEPAGDAGLR